jgi:hypothetical protein
MPKGLGFRSLFAVALRNTPEVEAISMACFGNGYPKITVIAKACFRDRNHLSEMPTTRSNDEKPIAF